MTDTDLASLIYAYHAEVVNPSPDLRYRRLLWERIDDLISALPVVGQERLRKHHEQFSADLANQGLTT